MDWDDDCGCGLDGYVHVDTRNLSRNQSQKTIRPMTRRISVVCGKYNKLK